MLLTVSCCHHVGDIFFILSNIKLDIRENFTVGMVRHWNTFPRKFIDALSLDLLQASWMDL